MTFETWISINADRNRVSLELSRVSPTSKMMRCRFRGRVRSMRAASETASMRRFESLPGYIFEIARLILSESEVNSCSVRTWPW